MNTNQYQYRWASIRCSRSCRQIRPWLAAVALPYLMLGLGQHSVSSQMQPTPSVLLPEQYYDSTRRPLAPPQRAPDFTLPLVQGERAGGSTQQVHLKDLLQRGRSRGHGVTVIVFWAFWCDTWKDVTRHLQHLRPGLQAAQAQVLCVAVDASQQPVADKALANGLLWFPVAVDRRSEVTSRYGVRRVPTVFVLDSRGGIRTRFEGLPTDRRLLVAVRQARQPLHNRSAR